MILAFSITGNFRTGPKMKRLLGVVILLAISQSLTAQVHAFELELVSPDDWRGHICTRGLIMFVLSFLLLISSFTTSVLAEESKPELVLQTGHYDSIWCVAVARKGRTIASGSWDRTIKIWDGVSGRELRTLSGHGALVNSVAFSPNERIIASGSNDGLVKLWDVKSGKEMKTFSGHSSGVHAVAFSPDGKSIVSGSLDKTIKLWDVHSGKELKTLSGHSEAVKSVAFSGKIVASASYDDTIKLWDAQSGNELRTLSGHSRGLSSIAFSPDGRTIASGSWDKTAKIWDVDSGKVINTLTGHTDGVCSVAFSPDGTIIASGSGDGTIRLWSLARGKELNKLSGHAAQVLSVRFLDANTLVSASQDRTIKLWAIESGKEPITISGRCSPVRSVVFSPYGRIIASASEDKTVRIWDADSRTLRILSGQSFPVQSVAFSRDGKIIASAGDDSTIKLWDAVSGKELRTICGHGLLRAMSLSPDGKTVALASDDRLVELWDVRSAKKVHQLSGHSDKVLAVAISTNGTKLASAGIDKTIKIWSMETGLLLRTLSGHHSSIRSVAFNPDGETIASGSADKIIKMWDVASGEELCTLSGHSGPVTSVAFSQDGKLLASASGDGDETLKLWDVSSGQNLRTLSGHSAGVYQVSFSSDGRTIASASQDKTVKLWQSCSGREIATLIGMDGENWAVTRSDGRFDSNNLDKNPSLSWVLPGDRMRAYPLEIFMRQYFEPGLLSRLLKGEKFRELPPLEGLNRAQPEVTIDSVETHDRNPRLADVTVSFKSVPCKQPGKVGQMSGVYNLLLFRDNQLVGYLPQEGSLNLQSRVDLSNGSDQPRSHTFTIKLPQDGRKDHTFSAFAFNVDQVKSQTTRFDFHLGKISERKKGRAFVVSFGVNEYDDPAWQLSYAVADAREYERSLVPCLRGNKEFADVVPITLTSPGADKEFLATKENLRDVLLSLCDKAPANSAVAKSLRERGISRIEPEDFLILSFSCHGDTDEQTGEFYLFPKDIGKEQRLGLTPQLESKGISSAELTDWLKDIDASDMVMVIDACHSGAAEGKEFKPGPMGSAGLGQLAYYKKMAILSASQAATAAKEPSNLKHGLLTFALLKEGLARDGRADAAPRDSRVYLRELLKFASEEVPKLDAGKFKALSVDDAMTKAKDVSVIGRRNITGEVQVPVFRDFSSKKRDVCILDLSQSRQ